MHFDVFVEVGSQQILVVVVGDCRDYAHEDLSLSEHPFSDGLEYLLQRRRDVLLRAACAHYLFQLFDLLHSRSENENVLRAHLLINLDIRSIHCSNDQASVHDEFHVRCP